MKYPLGENERESITSKTGKKLDDITLEAVKRGDISGEDIKISKADLEVATDWMHNQFVMDNMPLAEALETIGAWYNKTVVSQRSECMARRIHFRFSRKASLQEVVEALNEMKVAYIKIEVGRIVVYYMCYCNVA